MIKKQVKNMMWMNPMILRLLNYKRSAYEQICISSRITVKVYDLHKRIINSWCPLSPYRDLMSTITYVKSPITPLANKIMFVQILLFKLTIVNT